MGGYGSGRPTRHMSTSECIVISVKEAHTHNIALTYTQQSGAVPGRRAWMLCPLCSRRVGKLYLSRRNPNAPACRTCLQLNYDSQRLPYEEKQRTYERYLLEQGYCWCIEKYNSLPVHYLSKEEADYSYHRGQFKRNLEFLKLLIETMRMLMRMRPIEEQETIEAKILMFEKKGKPTPSDINLAMHEIEELHASMAA